MNEHVLGLEFDDMLSHAYQSRTRERLLSLMAKRPMSVAAYARGTNMSVQTMLKFLRGGTASFVTINKIERYLGENK